MSNREKEYNKYLKKITENLDISETLRVKAIESYNAVGSWLGECTEASEIKITPQGSFYLGTVVKPVNDNDEYDIDLICLLKDMSQAPEDEIKNLVGNRLKEHGRYSKMLDKNEGKRCWTLHYDSFHMDILPSVPINKIYSEPDSTGIRLTHKDAEGVYSSRYSNPFEYHQWFEKQMEVVATNEKSLYADREKVDISQVPLYKVKTPLQRAIQILKRHRDIMYKDFASERKENAPISIIITTLAAHAYENEESLIDALFNILNNMHKFIELRNGEYWIENPVMPQENFADKWREVPEKRNEFYQWLEKAKYDILVAPFEEVGMHNVYKILQDSFGNDIVKKSFLDLGAEMKVHRDTGKLYVSGLKGGLDSSKTEKSKPVKGHTFFGNE